MKTLTIELLKKINSCNRGIIRFKNTPELHKIDISNISEIITDSIELQNDIKFLIAKKILKLKKLTYKDSYGFSEENTYDENGNLLAYKNSDGYSAEYTYDSKGNELTYKDSDGYSAEFTYDENGNLLTYKNSNGFSVEYTYDSKGNLLTYKDSDGYSAENTYDEKGLEITDDYETLKYNYKILEIK